jgi:hypothetical protein
MPKIAVQLADVSVRSHTFRFVTPVETETLKVPNACGVCHADKGTGWVKEALRSWKNVSAWRVAN